VKHRDVVYDAEKDDATGKWFWKIYPKIGHGMREFGSPKFGSREAALAACFREINSVLDRQKPASGG
jgi:hypothetical protein